MSLPETPNVPSETPSQVTLALVQMQCVESKQANVDRALAEIASAAGEGANIVCLPELFAGLYPCQSEDHRRFDQAEPIPGPTSRALAAAAAEHGVVVVGSLFERRAAGLYHNTAVVFDADGSLAGTYRKMHVPDDPLYYEKFYFAPGDTGFGCIATRFGRLGILVCWDQWFPEAARLSALSGARIILYPTAIGWIAEEKAPFGVAQHEAWQTVMRSHAITNGLFVAAANRVGTEDQLEFWGGSFVCDPNGTILSRAGQATEERVLARCDLAKIDAVRTHWPFLRDRRVDAYDGLTRRYLD